MVNVALTYWLATRALRPLVARLASLLGYRLPETGAHSAWQLTTIVRLAPGLPFSCKVTCSASSGRLSSST